MKGTRVHGRTPGAPQSEISEHDRPLVEMRVLSMAMQAAAAGVVEELDPAGRGLLRMEMVGAAEHERWDDERPRLSRRIGEHQLPGETESVTNPGVATTEGIFAELHQHSADAEPFIQLVEVAAGLLLVSEQQGIEVQYSADRRVRCVGVVTANQRELEAPHLHRRRQPWELIDDGGVAEGLGIVFGGLVDSTAPDGGHDALGHAATIDGKPMPSPKCCTCPLATSIWPSPSATTA